MTQFVRDLKHMHNIPYHLGIKKMQRKPHQLGQENQRSSAMLIQYSCETYPAAIKSTDNFPTKIASCVIRISVINDKFPSRIPVSTND